MFMLKKGLKGFPMVLIVILLFSTQSVLGNTAFKDVANNHWANAAIQQVAAKNIIEGYPGGLFKPSNQVTRAEFAAMLVRAMPTDQSKTHAFTDVPASHWATEAINKALAIGFINANDFKDRKFEPNKPLTRAEMAKWMANGLASIEADYKQAIEDTKDTLLPIPEYYKGGLNKADIPYIAVTMGTGLLNGYQDYSFKPNGTTTRAEVAALLVRFLNVMQKKPADFLHLDELRAVGTTGTNVDVISSYRVAEGRDFTKVKDKKILVKGGFKYIHRMIFIDPFDKNKESIYTNLFYDTDKDKWLTKGNTLVISEKSFEKTVGDVDNFLWNYYRGGSNDALVNGSSIESTKAVSLFGFNSLATNNSDFEKNNLNQKYWEYSVTSSGIYTITTEDNSTFFIRK